MTLESAVTAAATCHELFWLPQDMQRAQNAEIDNLFPDDYSVNASLHPDGWDIKYIWGARRRERPRNRQSSLHAQLISAFLCRLLPARQRMSRQGEARCQTQIGRQCQTCVWCAHAPTTAAMCGLQLWVRA